MASAAFKDVPQPAATTFDFPSIWFLLYVHMCVVFTRNLDMFIARNNNKTVQCVLLKGTDSKLPVFCFVDRTCYPGAKYLLLYCIPGVMVAAAGQLCLQLAPGHTHRQYLLSAWHVAKECGGALPQKLFVVDNHRSLTARVCIRNRLNFWQRNLRVVIV